MLLCFMSAKVYSLPRFLQSASRPATSSGVSVIRGSGAMPNRSSASPGAYTLPIGVPGRTLAGLLSERSSIDRGGGTGTAGGSAVAFCCILMKEPTLCGVHLVAPLMPFRMKFLISVHMCTIATGRLKAFSGVRATCRSFLPFVRVSDSFCIATKLSRFFAALRSVRLDVGLMLPTGVPNKARSMRAGCTTAALNFVREKRRRGANNAIGRRVTGVVDSLIGSGAMTMGCKPSLMDRREDPLCATSR
mmetsp:Transcript_28372/g.70891  ORF Transcript_28372/g.70891 Transcript_28372/m.70891 type:complete len:247 (+) Transcript_28372:1727-2467(+)